MVAYVFLSFLSNFPKTLIYRIIRESFANILYLKSRLNHQEQGSNGMLNSQTTIPDRLVFFTDDSRLIGRY